MLIILILIALAAVVGLFFAPSTIWGAYVFAFSMYFLALIYALFGFAILNGKKLKTEVIKEISFNQGFFAALTSWGIAIIILGILFKFQLWPGAKQLLIVGTIWTIVLLVVDIYLAVKDENSKILAQNSIIHGAIALIIGILILTMSDDHVIRFFVQDDHDKKVLIEKYYDWKKTGDQNIKNDFDKLYNATIDKQRKE